RWMRARRTKTARRRCRATRTRARWPDPLTKARTRQSAPWNAAGEQSIAGTTTAAALRDLPARRCARCCPDPGLRNDGNDREDPMIRLERFDHMVITSTDVEKSLAFYRDLFGLQLQEGGPPGLKLLRAGSIEIGISPARGGKAVSHPPADHVGFRV